MEEDVGALISLFIFFGRVGGGVLLTTVFQTHVQVYVTHTCFISMMRVCVCVHITNCTRPNTNVYLS